MKRWLTIDLIYYYRTSFDKQVFNNCFITINNRLTYGKYNFLFLKSQTVIIEEIELFSAFNSTFTEQYREMTFTEYHINRILWTLVIGSDL